jgi:hypothetical protein
MPKYNASHAVRRIREKHGRLASEGTMQRRARAMFGTSQNLTAKQVIQLTRSVGLTKLALSPKVRSSILQQLKLNQKVSKYERKTFAQIATEINKRLKTPISVRMIKKINEDIISGMKAKGEIPKKTAPNIDPNRKTFVIRLRKVLHGNHKITLGQAAKAMGVTKGVLQEVLASHGTRFVSERKKIKIAFLERSDLKSGRKLSNKDLAKETKLPKSFVSENRRRRGRGSGTRIRRANLPREILTWAGFFTNPGGGVIDARTLRELTTENEIDMNTAISRLKKDRTITEVNVSKGELTFKVIPGERYFFITKKGQGQLNGVGHNPKSRIQRMEGMSLDELERLHDRLIAVRVSGRVKVSNNIMDMVTNVLNTKRFVEFKRKNKM